MNFIHNPNQIALYGENNELLAEVTFPSLDAQTVNVNHTFVDTSLRGQGVAGKLMLELVKDLREQKKLAVLTCSYAADWFEKHQKEYGDLVKEQSF